MDNYYSSATGLMLVFMVLAVNGEWHIESHTSDQDVSTGDSVTLMCRSGAHLKKTPMMSFELSLHK